MVLTLILVLYLAVVLVGYLLKFMNLRHLDAHGAEVPSEFAGVIDGDLLTRTRDYTLTHTRFGFAASAFRHLLTLIFLFGGILPWYNQLILSWDRSFVVSGILFFLLLTGCVTLLSIPFDLYTTFGIENRFGFNTVTPRLWVADQVKGLVVSTLVLAVVLAGGLWLVQVSPRGWWFSVWCFYLFFGLFMMYISPTVIEPLFNKYTAVDDPDLEAEIRGLMEKIGIRVSRVFKMDASRRSTHSNAYFTGIGRVKRIVLFDTLLEKLDRREILAVLAHEGGHWKKRHLLKGIVLSQLLALGACYLAFLFTRSDLLTKLFGVTPPSFYAKVLILGFLFGIVSFPLTPVFAALTRRYEREADAFAVQVTGDAEGLASSLVKLARDNLSNLHPHPWYAAFYYSHPPVVERVRRIRLPRSQPE